MDKEYETYLRFGVVEQSIYESDRDESVETDDE
jgi:hypothetical protein